MAKLSNKVRKIIFQNAINKLYGERLTTEKNEFVKKYNEIVLEMVKRTAKNNGVDYQALTTIFKPYLKETYCFYYKTDKEDFKEELNTIFYNEEAYVLEYEGASFDLVYEFQKQRVYSISAGEGLPHTGDETFSESERKKLVAIFKKYAAFMKDVVSSACMIRDVINSASTTKQLIDTLPEFGKLLPETEAAICTALVPVETINKVSALFNKR